MPATKPFGRVTAKDVAERAGVSRSLVSMYLGGNKNAWLSESTKRRIDEVVKTLGYQPNTLARALRSGRTNTIGLLMGGISDPFGGLLAEAIMDEVEKHGYRLFIAVTRFDRKREREALLNMFNHQIDGIIYMLSADFDEDFFRKLDHSSCPVLLTENHPEIDLDSVCFDLRPGLRGAIHHLEKLGCRSILLQTGCYDRMEEQWKSLSGEFSCNVETFHWNPATHTQEEFIRKVLDTRPDGIISQGMQLEKTAFSSSDYHPRLIEFSMLPQPRTTVDGVINLPFHARVEKIVEVLVAQIEKPSAQKMKIAIPSEFLTPDEIQKLQKQPRRKTVSA